MRALPLTRWPVSKPPVVLIVDDAADNREMYATFLSHYGFRVRQAADANEALAHIEREVPAVIVTDLKMPGLHGIELCQRIRQCCSCAHTGVIALTGLMLRQPEIECVIEAGADALLFKPCFPDALLRLIEHMLSRSGNLQRDGAGRE
jgi:CheY-like chemotaxis protein